MEILWTRSTVYSTDPLLVVDQDYNARTIDRHSYLVMKFSQQAWLDDEDDPRHKQIKKSKKVEKLKNKTRALKKKKRSWSKNKPSTSKNKPSSSRKEPSWSRNMCDCTSNKLCVIDKWSRANDLNEIGDPPGLEILLKTQLPARSFPGLIS